MKNFIFLTQPFNKLFKALVFSVIFNLYSCSEQKCKDNSAYFGGEIINPKEEYVTIYQGNNVIDSIKLDKNNRFKSKIKNVKPGFYHFKNGEFQYIFLEAGDSLMVRVNSIDFDESISYCGKGSKKNNFIIKMFLEDENYDEKISSLFHLNAEDFSEAMQHIFKKKINDFNDYCKANNLSKHFNKTVTNGILLKHYTNHENFIFRNKHSKLPNDFYSYRDKLNINNEALHSYFPYHSYVYLLSQNKAHSKNFGEIKKHISTQKSYDINIDKLKYIDELIHNKDVKNALLKRVAYQYVVHSDNLKEVIDFYNLYITLDTNLGHRTEIQNLIESKEKLEIGKIIPNVSLVNSNKKTTSILNELESEYTLFYFWSNDFPRHNKLINSKVNSFKNEIKEVSFKGVYTDDDVDFFNKSNSLNNNSFYRFINPKKAKEVLMISSIHKIILVNKEGNIISTQLNIFAPSFKTDLETVIN